jgi:CRP-like cAMP-binding protein
MGLHALSEECLSILYGLGDLQDYESNSEIISQGAIESHFFQLINGILEVVDDNHAIRLFPGDFFGEMGFLTDQPRTKSVRSLTMCKVLRIERTEFLDRLKSYPEDLAKVVDEMEFHRIQIVNGADPGATGEFFTMIAQFSEQS